MQERKRQYIIAAVCFVLFTASFIAFNPGFLTSDSLDQYNQALTGQYVDWHPPLMAFTWRQLNRIYQGPQVMLVLQLVFLWTSVYLLAVSFKNKIWYVLIGLFALAPFVLNFAGNIFKDTQMALAWLLAFSMLFHNVVKRQSTGYVVATMSLLLILYGTWIRPNGLTGAVPLLLFWAWAVTQQKSKFSFMITAVLLVVFTVAATPLFTGKIFNARKQYAEAKIYLHDLTAIYVRTGNNVFPAGLYASPDFDTAYLRAKYIPASFDFIWWNNDGKYLRPDTTDAMTAELRNGWLKAIAKYPGVYLKSRYEGFLYFLQLKIRPNATHFYYASPWMAENIYGYKTLGRGFHEAVFTHVDMHENMPWMKPWFWFFLNILLVLLIPVISGRRLRILYTALVFSSMLYILPQFFIYQIDTEFRYMYWNCIACTVAVCILVSSRRMAVQSSLNKKEEDAKAPSSIS